MSVKVENMDFFFVHHHHYIFDLSTYFFQFLKSVNCEVKKCSDEFNKGETTLREDILCFKNNKGNICIDLKISW